jgi:8-oxo-dGTP diphosphatase
MTPAIDKLGWLYIEGKRVLGARSRGKTTFYIPGGKRDPGESDAEALTREIKEELSVDLVPASIVHVDAFTAQADGKPAGTMVRVTCYRADFSGHISAAAEIEEVRWISHRDRAQCSPAMQIILDWLKERGLIE